MNDLLFTALAAVVASFGMIHAGYAFASYFVRIPFVEENRPTLFAIMYFCLGLSGLIAYYFVPTENRGYVAAAAFIALLIGYAAGVRKRE